MASKQKSSANKTPTVKINHKKNLIIIGVSLTVIFLVVLNFFTGFMGYGFNYVKCGQKPTIVSTFMGGSHYFKPSDPGYAPDGFSTIYFCSAEEAAAANYSPAF